MPEKVVINVPTQSFTEIRNSIPQDTDDWILSANLFDVCMRIFVLVCGSDKAMTSSQVGLFIKRLVSEERKVGGPYGKTDSKSLVSNALILQIMMALGGNLPNVESYIKQTFKSARYKQPKVLEALWPLFWPNKIVSIDVSLNAILTAPQQDKPTTLRKVAYNAPQIVRSELMQQKESMRKVALKIWSVIEKSDINNEIAALNAIFTNSLKDSSWLNRDDLSLLDVANYYAWMAYAIYDDFIDDEGDPKLLSCANSAHRMSLINYLKFAEKLNTNTEIIMESYDIVDQSNLEELLNYRVRMLKSGAVLTPKATELKTSFLANRAIGHILGPRLIVSLSGLSDKAKKDINELLRHYLIARQINDDIHDWCDDLDKGHISFALSYLLKKVGVRKSAKIDVSLKESLREYYWQRGLKELNKIVIKHIKSCLFLIESSDAFVKEPPFYTEVLSPIQNAAEQSIRDWHEKLEFLENYAKP